MRGRWGKNLVFQLSKVPEYLLITIRNRPRGFPNQDLISLGRHRRKKLDFEYQVQMHCSLWPLTREILYPGAKFDIVAEELGLLTFVEGSVMGLEEAGAVEKDGGFLAGDTDHAADGLADTGEGGLPADLVVGYLFVVFLEALHAGALDVVSWREGGADDDGSVDMFPELVYAFCKAAAKEEQEDFLVLEGMGEEFILFLEGEALGLEDGGLVGGKGLEEGEDGFGVLVGWEVGDNGAGGGGGKLVDGLGGGVVVVGPAPVAGVDAGVYGELVGFLAPGSFGLHKGGRVVCREAAIFGEGGYWGKCGGEEEAGAELLEGGGNFVGRVEAVEAVLAGLGGPVQVRGVRGGEEFFEVEEIAEGFVGGFGKGFPVEVGVEEFFQKFGELVFDLVDFIEGHVRGGFHGLEIVRPTSGQGLEPGGGTGTG